MIARVSALWKLCAERLGRGWPFVVVVVVFVVAVFGAGTATGWYLSDRYSPRSAPDIVVTIPDGVGSSVEGVTMPDLRGLDTTTARQVLADVGLGGVEVREHERPWVGAEGRVVAQEPAGGQPVPPQIDLYISAPAVIPDVVDTDVTEAVQALQMLGAEVAVRRVYREGVPADRVLAVSPAPGEPITTRVELTASAPPSTLDLTQLRPVGSDCSRASDLVVNGTRYATGLTCRASRDVTRAVYLLGGHTAKLTATIGQPDTAEPGHRVQIEIVTDGTVVLSESLGYGEAKQVTVPTEGVLRLELRARLDPASTGNVRATAVFAGVQLVGGGAELLTLKELQP